MRMIYARTAEIDFRTLLRLSDPETRDRAEVCLRRGRGAEIALGRYLARVALSRLTGLDPASVPLAHDDRGRPFFPDHPEWFVSISRGDGLAAALVHPEKAVFDLQAIRRFPGEAVRGFFSAGEYARIRAAENPDREMTRLFCRRECLVKWMGRRPGTAGWDAEAEWRNAAPGAVFTETELESLLLCVLGPAEAVETERVDRIGGCP